jgi:superfamily I DNA/RNA helicase
VDEFQDVAPELVAWLRATLAVNAQRGEVSVTAIGDDYQSIYGWRGSHPSFILDYPRFFGAPKVGSVELDDNFRCRQEIIDAAESVLAGVQSKSAKHGRSRVELPVVGEQLVARPQQQRSG